MPDYESNSHKSKKPDKKEPTQEKKVAKAITSNAKVKKKGKASKLAEIFVPEDVDSVKDYIFLDIFVPAIKKLTSDIITNTTEMILYGETKGSSNKNSSVSKVSYRSYYDNADDRRGRSALRARAGYSFDDVILDNRGEAEEVLMRMDELVELYGVARVADLYELVGVTGSYTDNNYGWTNTRSASVVRVREGYLIKMPKALPLD